MAIIQFHSMKKLLLLLSHNFCDEKYGYHCMKKKCLFCYFHTISDETVMKNMALIV